MTMCVYMRNAVLHVAVGPKSVVCQLTFLKKWTWSVWGRSRVQSRLTVEASGGEWLSGREEDMGLAC
jgi:hypothetical protein